jgi:ferredoxin
MELRALNEDGEFVNDEEDEEIERKVMTIANADNCIGCEACARVCRELPTLYRGAMSVGFPLLGQQPRH